MDCFCYALVSCIKLTSAGGAWLSTAPQLENSNQNHHNTTSNKHDDNGIKSEDTLLEYRFEYGRIGMLTVAT